MSSGLIYSVNFDTTTKTLGFYDKAGNLIYSCVVDTEQPLPVITDDPTQPLYLRSTQAGSTVYLQGNSSYVSDTTFEKSTDGTTWSDWALTSANAVTLNRGDGLYIRAKAARTSFPTDSNTIPVCIRMTGTIEAYHNCYSMLTPSFSGLTNLTTIGAHCLQSLFTPNTISSSATARNTALIKAPLLPATTLSNYCYFHLYHYCTALTQASALPATNLANYCYAHMYKFCQSLTQAPALPATVLEEGCYQAMFDNTALTATPNLPANVLATYCYAYMFNGVSTLNEVHIAATNISASYCMRSWLDGVAATGTFYCVEGVAYPTGVNGCPSGWVKQTTFVESPNLPLCFKSTQDSSSVTLKASGTVADTYESSPDGLTWTTWTADTAIPLDNGDKIFVRTAANRTVAQTSENYIYFTMSGQVEAYNNINSLLQKTAFPSLTDLTSLSNSAGDYAFVRLFKDCTALVKAPLLPATTLTAYCYVSIFNGASISTAPELPATTLAVVCYASAFANCTSLIKAPELPATDLPQYCYTTMFKDASNLNEIHISATNISATNCLSDWVDGVAATGTFYCVEGVAYPVDSTSGIPQGWTVHRKYVLPSVGDTVTFGTYPQATSTPEDIEWTVLDVDTTNSRALLIAKKVLDKQQYYPTRTKVTWETCSLRTWLNGMFKTSAFDSTEQGRINLSHIENPDNPTFGTSGGNATDDYIFCLSIQEASNTAYFADNNARMALATQYAIDAGASVSGGYALWWLRSPGSNSSGVMAACVDRDGTHLSAYVNDNGIGVRPALWLNY